MSSAYSNSPALRLQIADSPLRRRAYICLVLLALGSLWYCAGRGYPLLAIALAPLLTWVCWSMPGACWQGAELCWRQGAWQLSVREQAHPVALLPGAVALPWVALVPFQLTVGGARRWLWIFADSVPFEQWRRLRVRLRLPDPGRGAR